MLVVQAVVLGFVEPNLVRPTQRRPDREIAGEGAERVLDFPCPRSMALGALACAVVEFHDSPSPCLTI
jgi:hypothetical protein